MMIAIVFVTFKNMSEKNVQLNAPIRQLLSNCLDRLRKKPVVITSL